MQNQSFYEDLIKPLYFNFDKDFPVVPPCGMYTIGEDRERLHYHNGLELGYCFKGSGVFFVNNKIYSFSKGDVSIIFENEAHIAKSYKGDLSDWKFATIDIEALLAHIGIENSIEISKILKGSDEFVNIIKRNDDNVINFSVYEIIRELEEKQEGYKVMVRSHMWTLMNKLVRTIGVTKENKDYQSFRKMGVISPALNYLTKNYFRDINVKQLANMCNLSIPHFRRLFGEVMKCSPMEYFYNIRIKMAATLLQNQTTSIMEISLQVGYSSITSFNRHFKRIKGVTPKEWRYFPFYK